VKSYSVKELMVPLSEYATVTEDATLYEAVLSLEEAQEKFEDKHTRYRHRAVLILDKNGNVIGKLGQLDVLRALEPKYQGMIEGEGSHRFGFTKEFMQSTWEDYNLFANPLDDICRKAHRRRICLRRCFPGSRYSSIDHGPPTIFTGNPGGKNSRHFASDGCVCGLVPQNERVF